MSSWTRAYMASHGYSSKANYAVGGNRSRVLARDGAACVRCGMTDAEHKARWGRPITIDHINKDRSDNRMSNLQTLCLSCHGRKDLIARLREPQVVRKQDQVLAMRSAGATYRQIADATGFSIGAVWKWVQRWQ